MFFKNKVLIFFCVLLIGSVVVSLSWGFSRKPPQPDYIPGRVVMKFVEGVGPERAAAIIEGERCSVERALKRTGLHLVKLPDGMDVPEAIERFKAYSEVLYVEPDYRVELLEEK